MIMHGKFQPPSFKTVGGGSGDRRTHTLTHRRHIFFVRTLLKILNSPQLCSWGINHPDLCIPWNNLLNFFTHFPFLEVLSPVHVEDRIYLGIYYRLLEWKKIVDYKDWIGKNGSSYGLPDIPEDHLLEPQNCTLEVCQVLRLLSEAASLPRDEP